MHQESILRQPDALLRMIIGKGVDQLDLSLQALGMLVILESMPEGFTEQQMQQIFQGSIEQAKDALKELNEKGYVLEDDV